LGTNIQNKKQANCFILAPDMAMRILIVTATQQEIEPLFLVNREQLAVNNWQSAQNMTHDLPTENAELQTAILVTGVGMVATAFALGRHLAANQYDLALNLGIAGSFDRSLNLGEVVEVTTDVLAELGAEDDEGFLTLDQLGFGESVFNASTSVANLFAQSGIHQESLLPKLTTGVTVNTVHGNEQAIRKIVNRLQPQVESMEGAAFFYACRKAGVPCIQIRAVSNYVEKRNRDNWQIGLAIKNLNTFADALLKQLSANV